MRALKILLSGVLLALTLNAYADEQPKEIWPKVRLSLFQDRPIEEGDGSILQLEAPDRAADAAIVPLSIKTQFVQSPEKYIQKIYLIIDRNPSPIGAVFHLTPDSGRADIDTRVRIEEYTHVRAIAEMNDGKLFMTSKYVKAAGGCSAPAGKDQEAALARIGKMKFRLNDKIALNQPNVAQLMISHPNNSGLAMDQLTRLYVPAHFVRRVEVTYAGRPILTADIDFTISEDPNFRFYFVPREEGELKAEVVDTKDLEFKSSVKVNAVADSSARP